MSSSRGHLRPSDMVQRESNRLDRWGRSLIDREWTADYRFFQCRQGYGGYARAKIALDIAAVIYLIAVVAYASLGYLAHILPTSAPEPLAVLIDDALLFTPLLGTWLSLLLFALLLGGILLHESYPLNYGLMNDYAASQFIYSGFLRDNSPTITKGQRTLAAISSVANRLCVVSVTLSGAALLWSLRTVLAVTTPALLPVIVFGGIILSIMGAFALLEFALGGRSHPIYYLYTRPVTAKDQRPVAELLWQGALGWVASAAAFGAIRGIGLHQGLTGGLVGAVLGAALALGITLAYIVLRRIPDQVPSTKFSPRLLFHGGLALLSRLTLALIVVVTLVLAPIVTILCALFFVLAFLVRVGFLAVWWTLGWIICLLLRLDHRLTGRHILWKLEIGWTGLSRIAGRRFYGSLPTRTLLRLQERLRGGLLAGDGWLARMVTVEPLRILQNVDAREFIANKQRGYLGNAMLPPPLEGEGTIAIVDPFDPTGSISFQHGQFRLWGFGVSGSERLLLRSLALIVTTYLIAFVAEYLLGKGIILAGGSALDRGIIFALVFGVAVGIVVALVSLLGRSSVGGFMVGVVSGMIALSASGVAGSLVSSLERTGIVVVLGFFLQFSLSILGRHALFVLGLVRLGVGVYLQLLAVTLT